MSSVEAQEQAGRVLVERLRRDELDSIASEVAAGRREHILKTLDERGRAQELVRQQYTGRYPFELLQNANDASGDEASQGHTALFALTPDALLVADKGAGFGPAQIRAICGLGRSSKDPRKSIGYKGLGFKSVGEITDDPQIFSIDVGFRFNEDAVRLQVTALAGELDPLQRLPVYAFPFSISPSDAGRDELEVRRLLDSGYRTIFRLPLRSLQAHSLVSAHLAATLSPRLLLFLDATDRLELRGTDNDFVATALRENNGDHVEMLVEAYGQTEHWLVFERQLPIPESALVASLGDAWREVERVRVAAAVPLDHNGLPTRMDPQPVHVYFPTQEQSGFGLVLQADFSLELDRRRIAGTPEADAYNSWLAERLGELVGREVARGLASRFPRDWATVSALALVGRPSGFGARIVERAIETLKASPYVPTVSGATRAPGESLLLPHTVPAADEAHALIGTSDLGHLVVAGIELDVDARSTLRDRLGAPEMTIPEALSRLQAPDSDTEVVRYYEFLVAWAERAGLRSFAALLASIPCVRTVSKHWRCPEEHLFFPRQREELRFPEGLPIPIVDVPAVDGLRPLLESAGVSSFEWRQLLPDFIFPILSDPDENESLRLLALEALRLYYQTERSGDPRLRSQAARVLLPAHRSSRDGSRLVPVEEIYFSADWLGSDSLERIYGPFDRYEFLDVQPPDDPDRRPEALEFFEWLGVARHPRPDARVIDQRDVHMVHALARHPHATRYSEIWELWLATAEVQEATQCGQGHIASQQLRASFGLDRLPELVESADPVRLGLLWEALAHGWGTHYQRATVATFYCQHTSHAGERTRTAPSLMMYMLRELGWVPCHRRAIPELARPREVWRLTRDTPRRVAERVPALPATMDQGWAVGMTSDLEVVDAARPKPGHLVHLLRDLACEWNGAAADNKDVRVLIDAARWAMRTLNDVLGIDAEVTQADEVPLLARLAGERVFHTRPFIAEDTLLAETWEPTRPILDADRDLRQLHDALKLPSLDKLTSKTPVPLGARPEVQDAIRVEFNAALPFLAAVAVDAVPSRAEDVYRQLARLEIQVCDDLVVRYSLGEETRERQEAVAFIAVRQEQDGIIRRNIGTAYLELEPSTGKPHWYVFGPLLARFLNVPTQGDAFSLLLSGSQASRREYLRARLIPDEVLEEARIRLEQPPPDDDLSDLLGDLRSGAEDEPAGAEPTASQTEHTDETASDSDRDPRPGGSGVEPELPPINHDAVSIADLEVGVGDSDGKGSRGNTGGGGGLGPTGPADHERRQRLQRTIGRRGEQAVYEAERRRVQLSGQDPGRVVWRSERHPFAPYDIESIDADGQTMYIEVKATSGDDPFDAFDISHAELMWALRQRSRYYIYRVTNAHQAVPMIARFRDPIALLRDGSAGLALSGARLAFQPPSN